MCVLLITSNSLSLYLSLLFIDSALSSSSDVISITPAYKWITNPLPSFQSTREKTDHTVSAPTFGQLANFNWKRKSQGKDKH